MSDELVKNPLFELQSQKNVAIVKECNLSVYPTGLQRKSHRSGDDWWRIQPCFGRTIQFCGGRNMEEHRQIIAER